MMSFDLPDNLWFHFRGKITEIGSHLSTETQPKLASRTVFFLSPSPQHTHKGQRHINMSFKRQPKGHAHAWSASAEIMSLLNGVRDSSPPPPPAPGSSIGAANGLDCEQMDQGQGALSSLAFPWASLPMCSSQLIAPSLQFQGL